MTVKSANSPPVLLEASLTFERYPDDPCRECAHAGTCAQHRVFELRVRGQVSVGEKGWAVDDLEVLQGDLHALELTEDERESAAQALWERYEVEVEGAPTVVERVALAERIGNKRMWAIVDARGWPAAALLARTQDEADFQRLVVALEPERQAA